MTASETQIGRITLSNPVICGSGEHVMTEAGLKSALAAGVGAVVAKSVNETQAAKDQLDRTDYALLDGSWNRLAWNFTAPRNTTLACRSGLQTMDFDPWLEIVARLKVYVCRGYTAGRTTPGPARRGRRAGFSQTAHR